MELEDQAARAYWVPKEETGAKQTRTPLRLELEGRLEAGATRANRQTETPVLQEIQEDQGVLGPTERQETMVCQDKTPGVGWF